MTDPRVTIIDDLPQSVELLRRALPGVDVREPSRTTPTDLSGQDLVLVDFKLDQWSERAELPELVQPANGLALAALIRAAVAQLSSRPFGVALLSNEVDRLQRGVPTEIREHALARLSDLEWVFAKPTDPGAAARLADRVRSLAAGIAALPHDWPEVPGDALAALVALLELPEAVERELTQEDVLAAYPPAVELSLASEGLAAIRWLLHRILPYPTFLLDDWHVAARLGIEREGLEALGESLAPARYRGIFANVVGPRWWRSGVDRLIFDATSGRGFDAGAVRTALDGLAGTSLPGTVRGQTVVAVGAGYKPVALAGADEVAQLELDDWPPYAQPPFARIEDARADPGLLARVVPSDRRRIDA